MKISSQFRQQCTISAKLVFVVIVIEIINLVSQRQLNTFAIFPRDIDTVWHLLLAPFLHQDLPHFYANIISLALFSFLVASQGKRRFLQITLFCIVCSGLLVWVFARSGAHLGASGLIYAYFGFLLIDSLLSRALTKILLSIILIVLYGGLFFGMMPNQVTYSWESHLFGFLSGALIAYLYTSKSS